MIKINITQVFTSHFQTIEENNKLCIMFFICIFYTFRLFFTRALETIITCNVGINDVNPSDCCTRLFAGTCSVLHLSVSSEGV